MNFSVEIFKAFDIDFSFDFILGLVVCLIIIKDHHEVIMWMRDEVRLDIYVKSFLCSIYAFVWSFEKVT